MAKLTPQGVCYDLEDTPYVWEWRGVLWHFSSAPHMSKFRREVRKRELWLNDSLTRRFFVNVRVDFIADVQLYCQVESRGFYIVTNDGAVYTDPSQIVVYPNLLILGIIPENIDVEIGDNNETD